MMRRTLGIIFFLVVLSGFLYLANVVVYKTLATIFNLNTMPSSLALGIILGILSGSFVAATLLGMRYYNWFTRWYYTITATWMGFFVYLFFISVAYILVTLISEQYAMAMGILGIIIAFVASIYGLVHARNIVVKKVTVSLANLPLSWIGRRIIWVSDLHLGQLHSSMFAQKVVEKINAQSHDIVFIGGDLFDGTDAPDIAELIAPLKQIVAPMGVYFVTGNHEEFANGNKFIEAVRSIGVRVLMDQMVDIEGLQLLGVDYSHASEVKKFRDILQKLKIDSKKPSILLKHEPKNLDIAEGAGISLQISGHTHRGQQWPLEYVTRAVYRGFSYGLKNFKDMQVYVSSGVGTWGPPLRVGTDSEIVIFTFETFVNKS